MEFTGLLYKLWFHAGMSKTRKQGVLVMDVWGCEYSCGSCSCFLLEKEGRRLGRKEGNMMLGVSVFLILHGICFYCICQQFNEAA